MVYNDSGNNCFGTTVFETKTPNISVETRLITRR
jgi:hypothetical protein